MDGGGGVQVALATFNGARFLAEQLASLVGQTRPPVGVIAGDDGSTDCSVDLVRSTLATRGIPLEILPPGARPLGPRGNFSRILARTTAPYVALCDQDDAWDAPKLERMMALMTEGEARRGSSTPLLVCCDLRLIDDAGRPIAASFRKHQRYSPVRGARFGGLLVMNCFPGCAMLMNRALADAATPIPEAAVMHDWWVALVATALGEILICREPLMSYRIHARNVIGVPADGVAATIGKVIGRRGLRSALAGAIAQAQAFQQRFGPRLGGGDARRLAAICHLAERGWFGRRWDLLRHGIAKHGPLRQMKMLLDC